MADIGSLWVKLGLKDAQYNKGLDKAKTKTKGFAKVMKGLGPLIGGALAVGAVVKFGKAIFNLTAEFGSMMSRVQALTGANDAMTDTLEKQAKILGRETQFTATQAAEAMTFLAQAGLDVNQIYSAMPNALELAAAGQITLAEAADISTNIMSAYGLQAEDLGRVNDIIANTSTNANTNVREFAEAFKMVGPIAKSANQGIEEVSAAIGLLANAGIKGTMAGTALRTMMSKLIKPTGDAIKILEKFGIITLDEVTGNLRPLNDILIDMQAAGMGTADMFEIFDLRAAGAATVLKNASGTFDEFAKTVGITGTAARIASQQMDNLKGDTLRLKSAWEGALLSIGLSNEGFLRSVTQMATSLINTLTPSIETTFDELEKLKKSVAGLEDTLPGLLEQYEKLSGKANKTEEENEKLRKVMDEIAGIVPTAVTAWNDHGEALSINVTAAGKFLEVQKALLKLKNADEINKQKDSLEGYGFAVKKLTRELNEGRNVMVGSSLQAFKLSGDEIEENRIKIEEYNAKIKQTELILAGLTGEYEKYNVIIPKTTEEIKAEKDAQDALTKEINAAIEAKRKQLEQQESLAGSILAVQLKAIEEAAAKSDEQFGELNETWEDSTAGILALADGIADEYFPIVNEMVEQNHAIVESFGGIQTASQIAFASMKENAAAWAAGMVESTAASGAGLKEFGSEVRRVIKQFIALAVGAMVAGALKDTALFTGPFGFMAAPLVAAGAAAAANSAFDALIPSFATGIDNVPHDMLANIHEGEAVIPKAENRRGAGARGGQLSVVVGARELRFILDEEERMTENSF